LRGVEKAAIYQGEKSIMKRRHCVVDGLALVAVMAMASVNARAFSDADWSALGAGMTATNSRVSAIVVWGTNVYAGGAFTNADGITANAVAKWDGTSWTPLGSGMDGPVYALAVLGTNLYAGGAFTTAGGNFARAVARWDGNNWSMLGNFEISFGSYVRSLAVLSNNLYAGGSITLGGSGGGVVKWNGSHWSPISGNPVPNVYVLAASSSNLYVGGAGFVTSICIARMNADETWSTLGSGVGGTSDNFVQGLAVSGSNVYVGGFFLQAGNNAAASIAKWNGNSWSSLDGGIDGRVYAIAVSGSDLYAGGAFASAGGAAANRIAKWNGGSWSALGSGVNSNVWALAVSGNDLYVGGDFTAAGGVAAGRVAKANISASLPGRFTNLAYSPDTGFSCTFLDASVGRPYRIESSPSLSATNWSNYTNFTYTGPIVITDSDANSGADKFFRAVTP
jgi:hypothetical protein